MVIGLHPDPFIDSNSEKWERFLKERGVEVRLLDLLAPDALAQARGCDGVMWRWTHTPQDKQSAKRILYAVEHTLGIPVYPDTATAWHFDEKVSQHYLLEALDAPRPRVWLFWQPWTAAEWARTASYPVVFKLSVGAGASNVLKVESEPEALALIDRMFTRGIFPMTMNEYAKKASPSRRAREALRYLRAGEYPPLPETWWKPEYGYAYFQEFLPGNDFDTRVTVIGERAFAFRRMNRPGDFRASGSGRLEMDPEKVDPRCLEIAFDVSRRAGFQSMAYDFLYKEEQPVICEISYAFVDAAVESCPGHWDSRLRWIEGRMWPEEAQVEDFLARIQAGAGVANG